MEFSNLPVALEKGELGNLILRNLQQGLLKQRRVEKKKCKGMVVQRKEEDQSEAKQKLELKQNKCKMNSVLTQQNLNTINTKMLKKCTCQLLGNQFRNYIPGTTEPPTHRQLEPLQTVTSRTEVALLPQVSALNCQPQNHWKMVLRSSN